MQSTNCPNCGAEMNHVIGDTHSTCRYCNSKFELPPHLVSTVEVVEEAPPSAVPLHSSSGPEAERMALLKQLENLNERIEAQAILVRRENIRRGLGMTAFGVGGFLGMVALFAGAALENLILGYGLGIPAAGLFGFGVIFSIFNVLTASAEDELKKLEKQRKMIEKKLGLRNNSGWGGGLIEAAGEAIGEFFG